MIFHICAPVSCPTYLGGGGGLGGGDGGGGGLGGGLGGGGLGGGGGLHTQVTQKRDQFVLCFGRY